MAKFSRVGPVMINAEVHVVILGEKSFSQDGTAFSGTNRQATGTVQANR